MENTLLHFNGIDGETGDYLIPPISMNDAAELAARTSTQRTDDGPGPALLSFGLPADVDENNLAEVGWAIVFPEDVDPKVRKALEPLIELRKAEAGHLFKELSFKRGEDFRAWLERYDASVGDINPDVIPNYLLLVGSPEEIPFDFQFLLGASYAVGRLSFDTPEEYARHVQSVIDYERASHVPTRQEMVYWAPRHSDYDSTGVSADFLVKPLHEGTEKTKPVARRKGFDASCFLDADATKETLSEVLHGRQKWRPSLLFTASHGVAFPMKSGLQVAQQGALTCNGWMRGDKDPEYYFAASDLGADAQLHGLVAFFFACFGAGTPKLDSFMGVRDLPAQGDTSLTARVIAEKPFVAPLPRRMLAHPNGGALAVIGHVDRAWTYSLPPSNVPSKLLPFNNAIFRILNGNRIGTAMRDFSDRFTNLSAAMLEYYDTTKPRTKELPKSKLVEQWLERNDARNYALLGDPAVRLRVDKFQ